MRGFAAALALIGLAFAQVEAIFPVYEHLIVGGELVENIGTKRKLVASEEELLAWIKTLERPPKNATFVYDKSRGFYAVEKVGYEVDEEEALAAYRRAVALGKKAFYVPVRVIEPELSVHDLYARGIRELLAEGVTDFWGSSYNRVWNLKLAAKRLDGVVIKPGEVFSFNKALGPVSEETGYKEGLVILGDRTEKGVGGGVCQVSSTVFRTTPACPSSSASPTPTSSATTSPPGSTPPSTPPGSTSSSKTTPRASS